MLETILLIIAVILIIIANIILYFLFSRAKSEDITSFQLKFESFDKTLEKNERTVSDQFSKNREEFSSNNKQLREEMNNSIKNFIENVVKTIGEISQVQRGFFENFSNQLEDIKTANLANSRMIREEIGVALTNFSNIISTSMNSISEAQKTQLQNFSVQLENSTSQSQKNAILLKDEIGKSIKAFGETLVQANSEISKVQRGFFENFSVQLNEIKIANLNNSKLLKDEISNTLAQFFNMASKSMTSISDVQKNQLESFSQKMVQLTDKSEKGFTDLRQSLEVKFENVKASIELKLTNLQEDNSKKLDQMRMVVDEKLQGTLEKRLTESFKLVSGHLEAVHSGLGEMKKLASGVGDLKKVLTNVKTRGTWGEVQLSNLLEQIFAPEQYDKNVAIKKGIQERVEFAIKLPGRDGSTNSFIYLPIDAKFPQEDYLRLVEASEIGDSKGVENAIKELENKIKKAAKDIREKYIDPPNTTDFGIMFLPIEGLYAEVIRRTDLVEKLQLEYRIVVAGPTTLAAILNSLQIGFRTLAIEKRTSEVWKVLGAVKNEFGRFKDLIEKVGQKLKEASSVIDSAATKTRTIERKLRTVEELPAEETQEILELNENLYDTDEGN